MALRSEIRCFVSDTEQTDSALSSSARRSAVQRSCVRTQQARRPHRSCRTVAVSPSLAFHVP
jgi:hypothetical protein